MLDPAKILTPTEVQRICAWLHHRRRRGPNYVLNRAIFRLIDKQSGATLNRTQFRELEKAIFNGEIKTVVVWRLDRLSRSLLDGITLVADWCKRGIRIVSITQQIDLSGTMGQIIATVLFGFAQIELETLRERRAAGIAAAPERGVYTGRKAGTTKARPERARELRKRGVLVEEVVTALGVSKRTAERYLAVS